MEKVSHRHYSTGFFYGQPGQFTQDARYIRDWQVVAEVVSCDQRGLATASLRNKFAQGDAIELVGPDVRPVLLRPHDGGRDRRSPGRAPASADEISNSAALLRPAPLVPAGLPGELVIGRTDTKPTPGQAQRAPPAVGFSKGRRREREMKRYLSSFTLPSKTDQEFALGKAVNRRTCYQNVYPFGVFGAWEETRLEMEPITILYGGNGSGKTTLLNLMGDALGLERRSVYNRAAFFQNFVDLCQWEGERQMPAAARCSPATTCSTTCWTSGT